MTDKKTLHLPSGLSGTNVGGELFPPVHPHFAAVAEELLFYTSRYYHYTEQRLQEMGLKQALAHYKAQKLSLLERQQVALLLAQPASRDQLQALGATLLSVGALSRLTPARPEIRLTSQHADPDQHPMVVDTPAADPLLNMAARLHLNARLDKRVVRLSLRQLAHFLDSPNTTIRLNVWRATYYLHAHGFHLHNSDHNSELAGL